MTTQKSGLSGLFPEEIAEALSIKPFQGRQLFHWIHGKGVFDYAGMTSLPLALRERLALECTGGEMTPARCQTSAATGTMKMLFLLADGETVESVLIRDGDRVTICVSSQVGCPLKCAFCATGMGGFRRNLKVDEIVGQVLHLLKEGGIPRDTQPNIVYMGMGEPFRNYEAVVKSVRLLMHPGGLNVGARRITVSTAGEVGGMARFAEEDWQVRLSVSLHAANDEKRSRLVPLNRKFGLDRLHEAVREYTQITGRQMTFEWTLLDGVNDTPEDVQELAAYAKRLRAFVNLIPWNPVSGLPYKPTPRGRCEVFLAALARAGVKATLRREKGSDIDAACGQLRAAYPASTSELEGSLLPRQN